MEAAPRMFMLSLERKDTANRVEFGAEIKRVITQYYMEDGEKYNEEIKQIEQLRMNAVQATVDLSGISSLKKYYGQLHNLTCHFPMEAGGEAAIAFSWMDRITGKSFTQADIRFEQACILYNLGALHSQLGAKEHRSVDEEMKVACTYFQLTAGVFTYLKENFQSYASLDISFEMVTVYIQIMLGQAQECVLEKAVQDSTKSIIIAKISTQVVDYYKQALKALDEMNNMSVHDSTRIKHWKKTLRIKMLYFTSVSYFYMSNKCEEQQRFGERVSYLQEAHNNHIEAMKSFKDQSQTVMAALRCMNDVIVHKLQSAKEVNDFWYHENVPYTGSLPKIEGASLVKALPFQSYDEGVVGPDIFHKLPMEFELASQRLYEIGNANLSSHFQTSQTRGIFNNLRAQFRPVEQVKQKEEREKLPQALLKVKEELIKAPVTPLQVLDIDGAINEIDATLGEEEITKKQVQELAESKLVSAAKEMKACMEELKQTKLELEETKTQKTHFMQETVRLKKEVDSVNKSLENVQLSYEHFVETNNTLSIELEETKITLDRTREDANYEIERLTSELKETHKRLKSGTDESAMEIDALTRELDETQKKLRSSTEESAKENETLTKELSETKLLWDKDKRQYTQETEKLNEELEELHNTLKLSTTESADEIETLKGKLEQTKMKLQDSDKQFNHELQKLTTESEHQKETFEKLNQEASRRIEELQGNLLHYKHQTEELEKDKIDSTNKTEKLEKDLDWTKNVLEQTQQDRDILRSELKQYQLDFAKESRALTEVLNQTNQAMAEIQKRAVGDEPTDATSSLNSDGTVETEKSALAAEFGRLIVGTADSLTLDQSLQLAMLLSLPPSVSDALCRVSLFQSPGMKFLEEIRNRNIINMYDVTNLQKAFTVLKLENIKQNLLEPYQERVEDELHALHRAEEMLTWEDVEALNAKSDKTAVFQLEDSKIPPQKGAVEGLDESSQAETTVKDSVPSQRGGHQHPAYIEHNIGREGGIMHLAGASLTIPPDALLKSHVIGLTVTNETRFPLPREVDNARMTPLIKLEPLGLMFKKPLQLTIPHSALIPEPENHDVIIFSGQMSTNTDEFSDSITWTEERSLSRQLKEKTVTLNIQCLSYLSASLMSQSSEPSSYIVRAVPFVDGVRNDDDDIMLTVCFCGDNESEYSMLLSDYQTKLPLEGYSTLHLSRHSGTDDKDKDVVSLTISSLNNSYMPDMQQELVKDIAVSHLFAASRVSHQFRLKKNQQIDSDFVDLVLTISQTGNKLTEIFLKTRIKDLMISQKSEDLLLGSVPPAVKPYEDLKSNISSMLETLHCRQLAAYFELSPSETERVENNEAPGTMLIKILDEREKIMPQKMIGLFQGLKACHLDKIARLVSEYIDVNSKQTQETQKREKEKKSTVLSGISEDVPAPQHLSKKQRIQALSSRSDQSVQTILSSSCVTCDLDVKALTNEGYAEQEVVEALDIAKNRLHLARGILEYIGDQRVSLPKGNILLYKEQYIDENGGEIILREADIHMLIPAGAVSKGSIVSITMMTSKHVSVPSEGRTPQLTPVIKCGQEGMTLNKPVTLKIPHCASETEGITSTNMYFGFSNKGEEIQWRKRRQHEPSPLLKKDHFEVFLQTFCTISFHVTADYNTRLEKRLRVLPLINRIVNQSDNLTVTLWIYNDDETEHMHLLHEEITKGGKIQLHDFKRFTLKGSGNDKEVHIKSGNNKIIPHLNANTKNFTPAILWHNTRHSAEFHFQNKEEIGDIAFRLRLYTKQFLRTSDDLQFDLKVTLSELLQEPRESLRAVIKIQEPQPAMEKSFQKLIRKLSGELGVDSCSEIAGMFGLSSSFRDRFKESSEPGDVLFDKLIHEQLISAASVSVLDVALTRTGNVKLAEDVKEYRRRNATFPTTIFTLL